MERACAGAKARAGTSAVACAVACSRSDRRTGSCRARAGRPTRLWEVGGGRGESSFARRASTESPSVSAKGGREEEEEEEDDLRVALVERKTKETSVFVKINLDGTGKCDCASGVPFLDHMLDVSW